MQRNILVAGNWKLNGSFAEIDTLLNGLTSQEIEVKDTTDIVVCPPYCYLPVVTERLESSKIKSGAQNVSEFDSGAYTGEVSASMLKEMNCDYVIVGHSERRALFHEDDDSIGKKVKKVIENAMTPILCVGETQQEYDAEETESVITRQVTRVTDTLTDEALEKLIIAYEPVWAIGTGKTATPEIAQSVHHLIRSLIGKKSASISKKIMILYGGSVKPDNAATLFAQPDIDGGLIGGASLKAEDFIAICKAG